MRKRTLNQDIWQSITHSKGRFISIMCLMMLGAFGLVGLKVMRPNVVSTGTAYFDKYQAFDLAVISDYGLTTEDQTELSQLSKVADIEYGYFTDVTMKGKNEAIRLFSQPTKLSQFQVVSGTLPQKPQQIALAAIYQKQYQIGDTVEVQVPRGKTNILKADAYTVSGFVNSSEIISATNMGYANAGSGSLEGYGVVSRDVFDAKVHTIARISYHDLRQLDPYSESYLNKLEAHQVELDKWLGDNGDLRLADIQAEAQDKIQEGEAEIASGESQLAQAESELSSAKQEIDAHKAELVSASEVIATKENELQKGSKQLDSAYKQLANSKQSLDNAYTQLVNGQAQLDDSKAKIDEARVPLDQAKAQLDSAKAAIDSQQAQIDAGLADLEVAKTNLNEQIAQFEQAGTVNPAETVPELVALQNQINQTADQLAAAQESLKTAVTDYNAKVAEYEAGLAQLQPAIDQYEAGATSLANRWDQYHSGLSQYEAGLATYKTQAGTYKSGVSSLKKNKAEVESGMAELKQAQSEWNKHHDTFTEEKASAEADMKAARHNIDDARNEVAGLTTPKYTTYTRRTLPGSDGYRTLIYSADGMEAVSELFPLVLYLVAALVTMTTMTRFVNEERTNAGVLKALGYRNQDIFKKFTIYGLVAGLSGTLIGVLAGTYLLPYILAKSIFKSMTIPDIHLAFYWKYALLAVLCAIACSVLPALYVAQRELKEKPAYLLLPKPPVAGSTILLEQLPFIWKRLTFTQKVTARNIFRYKQRMLMTIFGVAGSVALLFGGFGITASLGGIIER